MRPEIDAISFHVVCSSVAPSRQLVAQEAYKVEELKKAPPSSFSSEIAPALIAQGYRIMDGQGKPYADLWLRKSVPASSRPSGSKGVIQFPFLMESELLGVIQLHGEAHDYRNQAIAKGCTPCVMAISRSMATIWA